MPFIFIRGFLFLLILSPAFGRAMDRSYRDDVAKNLDDVTQNFLKFNDLIQLERKVKFDFPKYTRTELDNFLKAEFGAVYDGYDASIDDYIRFFISRPVSQLQLWLTIDQQISDELGGFDGKPHAALTHQLLRSRLNYPSYHNEASLLLPHPISLVYGQTKSAYVDLRWENKLHFKWFASYLSDLFNSFDHASHALAASVLGAATITRIDGFKQKSYWELYPVIQHPCRDFYPAILAAAFVFHQFEKSGLKKHQFKAKQEWVQVAAEFPLHVAVLSTTWKDKVKTITLRNQQYYKQIIPPNSIFFLPKSFLIEFRSKEMEIAKESAYRIHKIKTPFALIYYTQKPNEPLAVVAKNFNSSVLDVLNVNGLSDSLSMQERRLLIKVPSKDSVFYTGFDTLNYEGIQEQIKLRKEEFVGWPEQHKPKPVENKAQQIHVVKSGDTLSAIGRKYRVSVKQIMLWNNLKSTNLQIGQKLIIKK
jgi:LysM repeat protein